MVDSGVDADHPAVGGLVQAVAVERDEAAPDGVRFVEGPHDDLYGHGTACAAIVRALAPVVELISVRVLGSNLKGSAFAFAHGLDWCIEHDVHVVNLSLSTANEDYAETFWDLVDQATFKRMMVVSALNNERKRTIPSEFAGRLLGGVRARPRPGANRVQPRRSRRVGRSGHRRRGGLERRRHNDGDGQQLRRPGGGRPPRPHRGRPPRDHHLAGPHRAGGDGRQCSSTSLTAAGSRPIGQRDGRGPERAGAGARGGRTRQLVGPPPVPWSAMSDRTLVLLKPDAVERGLVGAILSRFEAKGLTIVALELRRLEADTLARHYEEHVGKGFYDDLVAFMSRGPVVAMVVEGPDDTWEVVRTMMGATNPRTAAIGTIRGDFGIELTENLVHGSDSLASAEREINIFFPKL